MGIFYFVVVQAFLMFAVGRGHQFLSERREYSPRFQVVFMLLTVPCGIGLLIWTIYGVLQLPWWQALLGFVVASFLSSLAHMWSAGGLWANLWAIAASVAGMILMVVQILA